MNIVKIQNIKKTIITVSDIQKELGITKESAQVTASRYVKANLLYRLKRDFYILPQKFKLLSEEELFSISNLLQTPSYVSLTTALSYYNLTTQQTPNFIEAIALKRTKSIRLLNKEFNYSLVKKTFYSDFIRKENFFIALPEKALADLIYLTAIGLYNADFDAINFEHFDKSRVSSILINSNKAALNLWQKLIKNYEN